MAPNGGRSKLETSGQGRLPRLQNATQIYGVVARCRLYPLRDAVSFLSGSLVYLRGGQRFSIPELCLPVTSPFQRRRAVEASIAQRCATSSATEPRSVSRPSGFDRMARTLWLRFLMEPQLPIAICAKSTSSSAPIYCTKDRIRSRTSSASYRTSKNGTPELVGRSSAVMM